MRSIFTLLFSCLLYTCLLAQDVPETNIVWLDIDYRNGVLEVGDTHHVAMGPGYDNQPYFLHSNEGLLFSAAKGTAPSDIYLYYFSNGGVYNLTNTGETAEYSPKQIPGQQQFTTVTVEEDSTTQRLWQYDFPGTNRQLTFANNKAVGYYHWIDQQSVAAFILEDSFTLHHLRPDTRLDTVVTGPVGRCILTHPTTGEVTYVWKPTNDTTWWVMSWDPETGKKQRLMPTLPQVEDYAWLPDGAIIMADKGIIYQWQNKQWQTVADVSKQLPNFYRIVIGPRAKRMAVVTFAGKKP